MGKRMVYHNRLYKNILFVGNDDVYEVLVCTISMIFTFWSSNDEKRTFVIPPKIIFFWFKLIDTARKWCLRIGKTLKMQKK